MAAFCSLLFLVGVPYWVPGLPRLRLLSPLAPEARLSFASPPPETSAVGEAAVPAVEPADERLAQPEKLELSAAARDVVALSADDGKAPVPILDPSGHALDDWFAALDRVARKEPGARARMMVWGESNVAGDLLTSVLRRRLQAELGDGGHGYVLLLRPDVLYFHNDVRFVKATGWRLSQIKGPLAEDGLYGLDGTGFRAEGKWAYATLATAEKGTFGRAASRIAITYGELPDGDPLEVLVDGQLVKTIATRGDAPTTRIAEVQVADGPHTVHLQATGPKTRVFGVSLERDEGVIVDAVGMSGGKTRYLARLDRNHLAAQLAHWRPQLLTFAYGVNEAREGRGLDAFEEETRSGIKLLREAAPKASCLLIGPNDIGWGTDASSNPHTQKVVDIEVRLARELGCAFWDQRKAMGGDGAIGKWKKVGLVQEDMLHPSQTGAQLLGTWLHQALVDAYHAYRERKR